MKTKTWFVTYEVRELGAIGEFWPYSGHVEALTAEAAREVFRQKYGHRFEFRSPITCLESVED